jgi:hypothetical protein
MTSADEPDSPSTDPNPGILSGERATQTPNVASSVGPRESMPSAPPESNTLLSAPQVTREDLAFDQRLLDCERKLGEVLQRVEQLERKPPESEPAPTFPRWFWLVFLAALALAWQILLHFR